MSNSWLRVLLSAGWALLPLALTFSIAGHHQQADPAASLVAARADYPPVTRFLLLAAGLIGLELLLVCYRRLLRLNTEYLRCRMKTPWFLRLLLILYWAAVVGYALLALVSYLEQQPPGLGAAFANLSEFSYSFRWITNLFLIGIGLELAARCSHNLLALLNQLAASRSEDDGASRQADHAAAAPPAAQVRPRAWFRQAAAWLTRQYIFVTYAAIAGATFAAVQLSRGIYYFAYSDQFVGQYDYFGASYAREYGGLTISSPGDQIAYRVALLAILALSLVSMGIILSQRRRAWRLLASVVMLLTSGCVLVVPELTMQVYTHVVR